MIIVRGNRTKGVILVIASVLILGILSTTAQATKNYNSSKSNTSTIIGPVDPDTLGLIVKQIEQIGPERITERAVRKILDNHGVKGINHIEIQRRGPTVEVRILERQSDLPRAQSDDARELKALEPQKKHYRSKPNL
jgi:hypothetical protein